VALEPVAMRANYPNATGKVCVFVHGLSCTEWSWVMSSDKLWGDPTTCFGTKLADDLGYTPLYVRYNSGRHISDNGRRLAELLERVHAAYPLPIEELVLVGHSMGGLVARSAAHYGSLEQMTWVPTLRQLFCIGSPHLGAPLEKGTNLLSALLRAIPAAGAQVPAEVLNARSAGIKDLRWGYTVEEEWKDRDPDAILDDQRRDIPLLDHVRYGFVAATIIHDPAHPLGQLVGDLLVRIPSASGAAPDPARRIAFQSGRVFSGMSHLALANHPAVYETLRESLANNERP
jgi:pimeloyl-ACP methyl ester carboxylesterase